MERQSLRWTIVMAFVLFILALLLYARGDDSDDGRSPEQGPPAVQSVR